MSEEHQQQQKSAASSETSSISTINETEARTSRTNSVLLNQQHEQDKRILEELSRDMIKTTGDYIKGEVDVCIADYKLLEQMNKMVMERYKGLGVNSQNIMKEMEKLNEAYAHLQPLLGQIEYVEKSVDELEATANKLDAYSKRLEAKFKQFTDRINNR